MELINTSTSAAELNAYTTGLVTYLEEMSAFLNGDGPPPVFKEILPSISSADTIGLASGTSKFSSNLISGYLTDLAHHLSSAEREVGIRYKSRSSYYSEAFSDTNAERQVSVDSKSEYDAVIGGRVNNL